MRTLAVPFFVLLPAACALACTGEFSRQGPRQELVVTRVDGDPGAPDRRLPLSFTQTSTFTVRVEAHKANGSIDDNFNGYVRASIKPGTVVAVTGPNTDGRNVQLQNGVADGVQVQVIAAYGDARIWFEDEGYIPADPVGDTPPQCSNGKDDNGNGRIDYPADPGCAYANDDTEAPGTFATGTSDVLYFQAPRIADVRGIGNGGNGTPFPHEQVQMDAGWRGGAQHDFHVVVTRVASDGFYVTDLQDDIPEGMRPGYGSVFAFTYSTPPLMRVCDRLRLFGGTSSDFFGFTEIGFPTWQIEEWDPNNPDPVESKCMVPEPKVLALSEYQDSGTMFKYESALVRIQTAGTVSLHVTQKLGPGHPKKEDGFAPQPDATNCDFNDDGKITFGTGDENDCAAACDGGKDSSGNPISADLECSEYSAFASHGDFKMVWTDTGGASPVTAKIDVNASSSASFDPTVFKGQGVKAFTGTVRYFSGGSSFTIEARCDDDIVTDPNGSPLPSDKACVHARTVLDNNESSH